MIKSTETAKSIVIESLERLLATLKSISPKDEKGAETLAEQISKIEKKIFDLKEVKKEG